MEEANLSNLKPTTSDWLARTLEKVKTGETLRVAGGPGIERPAL